MSSPMTKVSSLVSSHISNYLTNKQTWSGILYNVVAYGAKGDGKTDDSTAFQKAINDASLTKGWVFVPEGNYSMGSKLVFTDPIVFGGASRAGVILDFSNLSSGAAVEIAKTSNVVGINILNFTIKGSKSINAFDIGLSTSLTCVDSYFHDMRIESFNIAFKTTYMWDCKFQNVRAQLCNKPLQLDSQSNALHFDTCQFVSYTQAMTLTNAEGIQFSSCDISNSGSVSGALSLFQSNVVMTNCYIENPNTVAVQIGSASEATPSQLVVNGGKIDGAFRLAGNAESLIMDAPRITSILKIINQSDAVPTVYTRCLKINVNDTNFNPQDSRLFSYDWWQKPSFSNAFGGGSLTQTQYRDYTELNQSVVNNGIQVATSLVSGNQYVLAYAIRRDPAAAVSMRIDSTTLTMSSSVPTTSDTWEIRYIPFVSSGTVMRLMFQGIIQVKMLRIYNGIKSSDLSLATPTEFYNSSAPTAGTWNQGDRIYNTSPAASGSIGWICTTAGTPGTWKTYGTISA